MVQLVDFPALLHSLFRSLVGSSFGLGERIVALAEPRPEPLLLQSSFHLVLVPKGDLRSRRDVCIPRESGVAVGCPVAQQFSGEFPRGGVGEIGFRLVIFGRVEPRVVCDGMPRLPIVGQPVSSQCCVVVFVEDKEVNAFGSIPLPIAHVFRMPASQPSAFSVFLRWFHRLGCICSK